MPPISRERALSTRKKRSKIRSRTLGGNAGAIVGDAQVDFAAVAFAGTQTHSPPYLMPFSIRLFSA